MPPTSRDEFEIAIICALTLEADAVEALFDETYDTLGQVYGRQSRDKNAYINGRIGRHNVVLCYLPGMGRGSAAAAAAKLQVSYSRIQLALVVGICGGVPFPPTNTEIILGDVIISDSVIEYDFGSQYPDGFLRKRNVKETLGRPEPQIRSHLAALKARNRRRELEDRIYKHLKTLQAQPNTVWEHPGIVHDVLFEASYRHKHHQHDSLNKCICLSCNSSNDPVCDEALKRDCNSLGCTGGRIQRKRLVAGATNPSVHIGTIASADTVMKSGEHRDIIAKREGAVGFEMEGAGVWDNMLCIIIKGVCDYADSHKNKMWQDYAAATAASCMKAFLETWLPTSPKTFLAESQLPVMSGHLRDYYKSARRLQIQRISGELLPMDQSYINLAVVEQSHFTDVNCASKSSPFSIFSRLKVETVDQSKQVSLPTLFEPRKQPDGTSIIPERILIQGRAGVGKTTLCKKITYDYLHHDMWRQLFDLLLWVPLRRLKDRHQENYTLDDLFHNLYFSELKGGKDLATDLQKVVNNPNHKNRILFVLDGLDEVSQELEPETPMNNLLLRLLDHPWVIITSRPHGMNLSSLKLLDLKLETIGFDVNQVEAYVKNNVKADPKKADGILAFLRENTLIRELVRIPIQLDALCYSWDRSFMTGDEPKTMTLLYHAITMKLWQKDIVRLGKLEQAKQLNEYAIRSFSASQIQELAPGEFNLLEGLAFIGLYNEVIEFNADDRHRIYDALKKQGTLLPDIPETVLKRVSFLHTSDTSVMDQDQSYHFLHLTFQEFFAARYFVRRWINREPLLYITLRAKVSDRYPVTPRAFVQEEKYNYRYDIMWRFTAGLLQGVTGEEQESEVLRNYFQELDAEPRDLLGPAHQRLLMHCLNEVIPAAQDDFNRVKMEKSISCWVQFECNFHNMTLLGRERECPDHILRGLIGGGSVTVKRCVLDALYERHSMSSELLEALLLLLRDDDWGVRSRAVKALGQQSPLPLAILEALPPLLKDDESFVRCSTAKALGQ